MKHLFSIHVSHEYDSVDEVSQHLEIVPASSNNEFIRNNELLFRRHTGALDCYGNENASMDLNNTLFFWVVCVNAAFFKYTDLPDDVNFSEPHFYWHNSEQATKFKDQDFGDEHLGVSPKGTIGCMGISINTIDTNDQAKFMIEFNTKKTYWTYHIRPKASQEDWIYKIHDEQNEWQFEQIENDSEFIMFKSKQPIPYVKKASNRLKLTLKNAQDNNPQEMILPSANYAFQAIDENGLKTTPIYIYI